MHTETITRPKPRASRELEAAIQGVRSSAFQDSIGGVILARLRDGASTYFTKGAEARAFWRGVYDSGDGSFDFMASEYDGLMQSPKAMHGRPDASGLFWVWEERGQA
jgi:hypothetical protein